MIEGAPGAGPQGPDAALAVFLAQALEGPTQDLLARLAQHSVQEAALREITGNLDAMVLSQGSGRTGPDLKRLGKLHRIYEESLWDEAAIAIADLAQAWGVECSQSSSAPTEEPPVAG